MESKPNPIPEPAPQMDEQAMRRMFDQWRRSRTVVNPETDTLNALLVANGFKPTRRNRRQLQRHLEKSRRKTGTAPVAAFGMRPTSV